MRKPPLIVGAGPAGMRAAATLAVAGLAPVVIDEAPLCGGQIYRQPLIPDGRSARVRYGSESAKAERIHAEFAALSSKIDYRPGSLVWNLKDGVADVLSSGKTHRIAYDGLILAAGATDRVLPVPGWTLPGVYTLGGAQIALKAQGVAIGRKVLFLGAGPLLYLVAWQYMKAGVQVAGILDSAPLTAKLNLLRGIFLDPRIVVLGLQYALQLRLAGVPIRHNVKKPRIIGKNSVQAVAWGIGDGAREIACDGVGYAVGLRPETQLADLAGCAFMFSKRDRAHVPQQDYAGRTTVAGVYVAGDGAGIAGADAAECSGELAALALLADRGLDADAIRAGILETKLSRIRRMRDCLEAAFPFPGHWIDQDDGKLCRCEEIGFAEARAAIADYSITEINRFKAVSRIGMGRCQGRICGTAAVELLSRETGRDIASVGRLRGQAPVKPIPVDLSFMPESE